MKQGIENAVGELTLTVEPHMTAELDGKEIHPLYSTFWIGKHAETAARSVIEPYFEDGEDAVGSALTINHVSMAAVGCEVAIVAKVSKVEGNKVTCTYSVTDINEKTLVAEGLQVQMVLRIEVLDHLIRRAQSSIEHRRTNYTN